MTNIFVEDDYFPYTVALEITLECNMRCIHCGSEAEVGKKRENNLDLEEWFKVVSELKKMGTKYFTLSGGEPFLYKNWRELSKYIKTGNDDVNLSIISNGSCISENDIKFLKDLGVSHLSLSLDGDSRIHNFIRNFPGGDSYKRVLDTIKLCKKNGIKTAIATSFNRHNFPIRHKILEDLINNEVKIWQCQIISSFGRANTGITLSKKQFIELIDDIEIWQKDYKEKIDIYIADSIGYCHPKTDKMLGENYEWRGCSAGQYVLGIRSNGDVTGCLSLQDDFFIEGNVREKSLQDIWNDKASFSYTRNYDSSKMEGACKRCDERDRCKAGCISIAYSLHNTIYRNDYCYKSIEEKNV